MNIGHHILLKARDIKIDITSEAYKDKILDKRDSFCKGMKFKDQKEWRIALYRGVASTEAYRLEIGDISDIVTWVSVDKMDKLFFRKIEKNIKFQIADIMEQSAGKNCGICFMHWKIMKRKCLQRLGKN